MRKKIIHTYETWEISSEAIIYCFIFFSSSNIFICCLEDEDFIIIAEIKELRLNIKFLKSRMQFPLKMHEVFVLTIDNLGKFKIVLFDPLTSKNWQQFTLLLVYTLHHVFLALFLSCFLNAHSLVFNDLLILSIAHNIRYLVSVFNNKVSRN